METIKILHICADYNRNNLYYELITELQGTGKVENEVYVPMNYSKNTVIKERNEKYPVERSQIYSNFDRFFFYRKEKKIYQDIENKIVCASKDIVHAHTLFSAGYIAYLLKNKYNIKYFVSVRNSDINTFFKYRKNLKGIGMEILKNADKIIFISKAYQEKLINKYVPKKLREDFIKKSIIMNNGLNEFWIENRFYLEGKDDNHNIQLLQVGEINKNKNLETTIKVVKKLNKMGYNTVLHIAGDGRRKNKIKKISSKNDKIIFYGKLKKEELLKLYRNSDIFVLPSKHETFGIVYIEAMSQSLPIIYSKGQGFDKVFEDGVVGYPIKYNSTKEMVEKIILIKEKYKEISKSSYEKSSLFDWKIIAKKYIELL